MSKSIFVESLLDCPDCGATGIRHGKKCKSCKNGRALIQKSSNASQLKFERIVIPTQQEKTNASVMPLG